MSSISLKSTWVTVRRSDLEALEARCKRLEAALEKFAWFDADWLPDEQYPGAEVHAYITNRGFGIRPSWHGTTNDFLNAWIALNGSAPTPEEAK